MTEQQEREAQPVQDGREAAREWYSEMIWGNEDFKDACLIAFEEGAQWQAREALAAYEAAQAMSPKFVSGTSEPLTDKQLLAEAEFAESYDASAPSFMSLLRDDAVVGDFQRRLLICMRAAVKLAAPVAQAEPDWKLLEIECPPDPDTVDRALWTDVRMELEAAGRVDLSAFVESATRDKDGDALRLATANDIQLDYSGCSEGTHSPGSVSATYPRKRTSIRGLVRVEYLPTSMFLEPHPDGTHINMGRHYLENYPGKYVVGIGAAVRAAVDLAAHNIKEQP